MIVVTQSAAKPTEKDLTTESTPGFATAGTIMINYIRIYFYNKIFYNCH